MAKKDDGMKEVTIYNCEVRLAGDIMHTQERRGITQREIQVIRAIHGPGGVAKIQEAGTKRVDEKEELYELALKYSKTINPAHGVQLVERTFNVILDGFQQWNLDRIDEQERVRDEAQRKANAQAARLNAAREAAEANLRAQIATENLQTVAI